MRIVVISDTHNRHKKIPLPEGDVLIHCGDATGMGRPSEIRNFGEWFCALPFKNKIFIAGNHDFDFEKFPAEALPYLKPGFGYGTHYLQDNGVEIHGVKFWGSPWTKQFGNWAFMREDDDPKLVYIYDQIPADTDVLITHGPPLYIRDKGLYDYKGDGGHCGLSPLRDAVFRVRPQLHVFGHIHEAYGQEEIEGIKFGNAAICDLSYNPINAPLVYDISPRATEAK